METQIVRNWWVPVIRGVAAIIFGILAYVMPGVTLASLVVLFGAYALIDGVFAIVSMIARRSTSESPWWVLLLEGVVGIAAGVMTFMWPGLTAMTLLYLIAAWSFFTGIFEIIAAIRLRQEIRGEWMLALGGVLSIMLGVALAVWPAAGVLALVWMIGGYAIVFGALMIGLGMRLRSIHTHHSDHAGAVGNGRLVYR